VKRYFEMALTALAVLSVFACAGTTKPTERVNPTEEVFSVSVCQILSDPARYNHKLIQVSGVVDHGFEGFVLSDAACARGGDAIWLEYGGKKGSGTIFAGAPPSGRIRQNGLTIDGISTSLVDDSEFERLDCLIQNRKSVSASATIIGRYFAGERDENYLVPDRDHPHWDGYGHLGFFTLIVIQQVLSVHPKVE
jgi:hypothetical protein